MSTITIRNLDSDIKNKLKILAAQHNRSMESEVRSILKHKVLTEENKTPEKFGQKISNIFKANAIEIDLPKRSPTKEPPIF